MLIAREIPVGICLKYGICSLSIYEIEIFGHFDCHLLIVSQMTYSKWKFGTCLEGCPE